MTDLVSLLDYSDLVCCGQRMVPATRWQARMGENTTVTATQGYRCNQCLHFVSQIAFLQNSHGTRAQRRARITSKEVGYATV